MERVNAQDVKEAAERVSLKVAPSAAGQEIALSAETKAKIERITTLKRSAMP